MKFKTLGIFLCAFMVVGTHAVWALDATQVLSFQNTLSELNRLKPLQNPRHVLAQDMLNRHIIDNKNKVVGEVDDLIIDGNGDVESLLVTFDRLRLNNAVFLNFETLGIKSNSSGFSLGFDELQIANIYPDLLAERQTAVNEDDTIRVTGILGRSVITDSSLNIGELKDILFDQSGRFIRSAYIVINYQAIHDRGIAIPFGVLEFTHENGRVSVSIAQDYADLIVQYAKDKL